MRSAEPAAPSSNGNGLHGFKSQPLKANGVKKAGNLRSFGHRNGASKNLNGAKRAFDYNRYFTDLMASVYSQSYAVETVAPDYDQSRSQEPVQANGQAVNRNESSVDPVHLISTQKSLIEDQRRLIQEQTKLIEEKSRLIAEKNQLLKMQSELIENKLL